MEVWATWGSYSVFLGLFLYTGGIQVTKLLFVVKKKKNLSFIIWRSQSRTQKGNGKVIFPPLHGYEAQISQHLPSTPLWAAQDKRRSVWTAPGLEPSRQSQANPLCPCQLLFSHHPIPTPGPGSTPMDLLLESISFFSSLCWPHSPILILKISLRQQRLREESVRMWLRVRPLRWALACSSQLRVQLQGSLLSEPAGRLQVN